MIKQFLWAWISNIKSIALVGASLFIWLLVSLIITATYDSCNNVNDKFNFIKEGCVNEGIRNNEIINTIFFVIFLISLIASIFTTLFESYRNR